MLKVFLAGPIQGWEHKQGYRLRLRRIIQQLQMEAVDPWQRERVFYRRGKPLESNLTRLRGMVNHDLKDIEKCDIVVTYLPIVTAGGCMELFGGKLKGKRTLVISPLRNLSPWILVNADVVVKDIPSSAAGLKKLMGELLV